MPTLQVYVVSSCSICAEARRIARQMADRFPDVDVQIVDLGQNNADKPGTVFATPTYVVDGRVVSLGNPRPEQMAAKLSEARGSR